MPIFYPILLLAHLGALGYILYGFLGEFESLTSWINVGWAIGFTLFWAGATLRYRWGALGYILLTIADIATYYAATQNAYLRFYVSSFFIFNLVLSIALLWHYRQLK